MSQGQIRIQRSTHLLDERAGYRISTDWGQIAVLEGGGHLCELQLTSHPGLNPMWKPHWTTLDPQHYLPGRHRRKYGPPPDGKLLAGIAGHSLSFDHFGPPSSEETAAGLSTHGEAPCVRWKRSRTRDAAALHYGCTLPEARIDFSRTIAVSRTDAVIYCEERAQNLSCYDRPLSWNEHVTFGPPFLESGTTLFDMSATRAKVCGPDYSDRNFLQVDAEFVWPRAPRKDGGLSDLRTSASGRFGHYTAQLLDPQLDVAFVSACNPRQGLLVVYAFRRRDFPWVGNWEESHNRTAAPWSGRTYCRGIEFSTTPFAIPRRDTLERGPLFGEPTYRWLPGKARLVARFMILLFVVPPDFGGVAQLAIEDGRVVVKEAAPGNRILTRSVRQFLRSQR